MLGVVCFMKILIKSNYYATHFQDICYKRTTKMENREAKKANLLTVLTRLKQMFAEF